MMMLNNLEPYDLVYTVDKADTDECAYPAIVTPSEHNDNVSDLDELDDLSSYFDTEVEITDGTGDTRFVRLIDLFPTQADATAYLVQERLA